MAVQLNIPCGGTFRSAKNLKETYQFLADVETSLPKHFPALEVFHKQGENTYRWEFETASFKSVTVDIKFSTLFEFNPDQQIKFGPSEPGADTKASGQWTLVESGGGTDVSFNIEFDVTLDISRFLKPVLNPIAQQLMQKLYDRYVKNVERALA